MAFGRNITQCIGRHDPCLVRSDCCYECQHNSWCPVRCRDNACHLDRVRDRLHAAAKEKTHSDAVSRF